MTTHVLLLTQDQTKRTLTLSRELSYNLSAVTAPRRRGRWGGERQKEPSHFPPRTDKNRRLGRGQKQTSNNSTQGGQ